MSIDNCPTCSRDLWHVGHVCPGSASGPDRIHHKFTVKRVDGTDYPGGKHDGCDYFVLDLTHDQHAAAALLAYAKSCADTKPGLARDLLAAVREMEN